ncbi:endopeptidase [Clostridium botulinum]|uniref:Endopeptidase n=1 Tax=Clostridium botulinum C/D str. DC5 TaxID=1443128 RepID=A0A0A0I447_CLOBO|nr:phage tail spike protein [Clostridium botulinum]KGM95582.1 endopeptidase [Clostridium botulinum C/D str. DC5]KOC54197.1 endopeptidase [Clostridium botulinum]KOC56541.1 endopeptidase [Clostridium botulinum]MCD3240928.1 endopeptidase [Clostridium botulinum D/C]MCD3299777.1 endopeptidase [Clostridium botulinum D/C]
MIVVYDSNEKDFKHNGLAVLNNCLACTIQEKLNNIYDLTLELDPKDPKKEYLKKYNIIKAPTPGGKQLFRIFKIIKNTNKVIVCGHHIFYDLVNNFLEDVRPTELTGFEAIKYILDNTQYKHDFKYFSDLQNKKNTAYYIRKNPIQAIMGADKNSFLKKWGGEILRDNFNIFINKSIGKDRGVTISYGKNLLGLEEIEDSNNVATRIMVTGLTEKNSLLMLPEKYIDSKNINSYPFPIIKEMHFKDIKIAPGKLDLQGAYKALKKRGQDLFNISKIDIPKLSYKINFILLDKTEEYKDFKVLQKVLIGDIVTVKHRKLNIDIKQKVIGYKYDSINKKYLNIDLGSFQETLSDNFKNFESSIEDVREDIKEDKKELITRFEKTDGDITAAVERINENKAEIQIAEKRITSNVEDKIKGCNTKIDQNSESIALVVDGGEINGNALVSAINMSNSKIGMSALNIDLDGYVTFRNLERGETTIDGSSIKAGTIDADEIGSRMSKVSKFIYFNGSQGVNGIGTKNNGRKEGYLWLYSSQGIIFDTDRVYMENGDRIATREWVEEQLEKINK